MRVGLIGLPGSGKTTVFGLLTGHAPGPESHSPGRGEANVGVVKVPDPRLERIASIFETDRTVHAELTLVDMAAPAGPSRGADSLDALARNLSGADSFALVLGVHQGTVDPVEELDEALLSLTLSDLGIVERRLERLEKDLRRGEKDAAKEQEVLLGLRPALEKGRRVADMELSATQEMLTRGFTFLTAKPVLVIANVGDDNVQGEGLGDLESAARERGFSVLAVAAQVEAEIAQLEEEERRVFLAEYGIEDPARLRCIRAAYDVLDAITFYTAAHSEARAWPVRSGITAVEAAGKIHTDMQAGFICAETVSYEALDRAGSLGECRSRGEVRLEGRDYVVQDRDFMTIRFSR